MKCVLLVWLLYKLVLSRVIESKKNVNQFFFFTIASRKEEVASIRTKFPNKVPVIVERYYKEKDLPILDKTKFLVPEELTLSQFVTIIRWELVNTKILKIRISFSPPLCHLEIVWDYPVHRPSICLWTTKAWPPWQPPWARYTNRKRTMMDSSTWCTPLRSSSGKTFNLGS